MSTQHGKNWLRNLLETETKTYPVNINIKQHHSEGTGFVIYPYGVASGKITAMRVQDLVRGLWFNWDIATGWDATPMVTAGPGTLYIAFYTINEGNMPGDLTLTIIDDVAAVLASKTAYAEPGAGVGAESGTLDMPTRPYSITLEVTP